MEQARLNIRNTADLRIKMAEHVLSQSTGRKNDDIRAILAETKVSVYNQTNLPNKLKVLFSAK